MPMRDVLAAGGHDLLAEQPVARVGADAVEAEVALGAGSAGCRSSPCGRRPRRTCCSASLRLRRRRVLEGREPALAELGRRHVDLEVELAELGLRSRGRRSARAPRRSCSAGSPCVVDQVELDLEADHRVVGVEPGVAQHPGEHVEARAGPSRGAACGRPARTPVRRPLRPWPTLGWIQPPGRASGRRGGPGPARVLPLASGGTAAVSRSATSPASGWPGSTSRARSTAHQASAPSPASHAPKASTAAAWATRSSGARRTRPARSATWSRASRGAPRPRPRRAPAGRAIDSSSRAATSSGGGLAAPDPRGQRRRHPGRRPGPRGARRLDLGHRRPGRAAGWPRARPASRGAPGPPHRLDDERVARRRRRARPAAPDAAAGRAAAGTSGPPCDPERLDELGAGRGRRPPLEPAHHRPGQVVVGGVEHQHRRPRPPWRTAGSSSSVDAPRRRPRGSGGQVDPCVEGVGRPPKVSITIESAGSKPSTTGTTARRSSGERAVRVVVMAATVPGAADDRSRLAGRPVEDAAGARGCGR